MSHCLSQLYQAVLGSPGNLTLLEELRKRSPEVLKHLRSGETEEELAGASLDQVPSDWLAQVYEALASAEPFPALTVDERERHLKTNERDEARIGTAFRDALLVGVSDKAVEGTIFFDRAPRVSSKEQHNLMQTPSVKAAWPECAPLVACGLTPIGVYYATKSVFPLIKRLQVRGQLPTSPSVVLSDVDRTLRDSNFATVPTQNVVLEFLQVARCSVQAAQALLSWLIEVAQFKPYVFCGGVAEQYGRSVKLTPRPQTATMDLFVRWGRGEKEESDERVPELLPH